MKPNVKANVKFNVKLNVDRPGSNYSAIGSLPHPNVDSAIAYAFRMGIPFLPQIPIRNPWEFMLPQALEGLPGLLVEPDGSTSLNLDIWTSRTHDLKLRLDHAFRSIDADAPPNAHAFDEFEPSPASASCWYPFVWELGERGTPIAKIQLAGPLTCQWALTLRDGRPADVIAELGTQIFQLVLARAIAMVRRLRSESVDCIFFFDEPALFHLLAPPPASQPKTILGLQQLKLAVSALKREGAQVGVHCCSDTDWTQLLKMEIDWLSLDAGHSLESLLAAAHEPALDQFAERGGRLSLGIIPTLKTANGDDTAPTPSPGRLLQWAGDRLSKNHPDLLKTALFTPACGLAYHDVADAEAAQNLLAEICRMHGSPRTAPQERMPEGTQ